MITVKDFNDTCRLEKKNPALENQENQEQMKISQHEEPNKDTLKDIIKNLLSEENLNETIK